MKFKRLSNIVNNSIGQRVLIALIGVVVNVLLSFINYRMKLPVYLDTVGTVAVSAIGGLYPGIMTAVFTNVACTFFSRNAIYFGFLNAMVAIITAMHVRRHSYKDLKSILALIVVLAGVSSVFSTWINWYVLDGATMSKESEAVVLFASSLGISRFWAFFIYNIQLNIIDKGLTVLMSWILLYLVPDEILLKIENNNWRQKPLSMADLEELNAWGSRVHHTMRYRSNMVIVVTSLLLVLVIGWSGISLYFEREKESKTGDAYSMLHLVTELVDAETVRSLVAEGESAPGYEKTRKMLQTVLDNYKSVENLSLVTFEEDRGRFVFDLSSATKGLHEERSYFEYDDTLREHLPEFMEGESVAPLEHAGLTGWLRSVTYPIKDENGSFICYCVAEISMTYMADYMKSFMVRTLLVFIGFFILIIVNNMWFTNTYISIPIRSMAKCVDDFSDLGYEQEQLDKNVKSIRALDIKTDDEVEKLYDSICRMTLNISEQMREIRRFSEATAKMQDGLIITMADMVENRDSDTGEHIRKTALYVKIIVEGLKRKGYYAEKITPKFMSDVVRSAPLHDIGKINIPDEVLNKPGKLTDEEFEIMKTHTTAGKKIMENAISTVEGENYLKEARNMAAYHHERWDGRGYPEGLHGEVIPLSARIMAVADVFDALTSPRVYKPAFPLEKALDIITEEAGKQFDPKCVEVFMESLPEVKVILKKYNRVK